MTTISEQISGLEPGAVALSSGPEVAPGAMEPPGMPVPDDPAAVSLFTAHRVHEVLHKLGHASQRMDAARDADGNLRKYHAARLAGHLEAALGAGHDLVAHVRAHYPDEAKELEAVKESVGLAKAVSGDARAATTSHLTETLLHELTHAHRHALQMAEDRPDDEFAFNSDHAAKHLAGAKEHGEKLRDHLTDNYPAEARWLNGLHEAKGSAEGKPRQHARYAGAKGAEMAGEGTIGAQMAAAAPLDRDPVVFDRRLFSDDLIRDLGGDPGAQGLLPARCLTRSAAAWFPLRAAPRAVPAVPPPRR